MKNYQKNNNNDNDKRIGKPNTGSGDIQSRYGVGIMKNGKRQMTEGIELPNQEKN